MALQGPLNIRQALRYGGHVQEETGTITVSGGTGNATTTTAFNGQRALQIIVSPPSVASTDSFTIQIERATSGLVMKDPGQNRGVYVSMTEFILREAIKITITSASKDGDYTYSIEYLP